MGFQVYYIPQSAFDTLKVNKISTLLKLLSRKWVSYELKIKERQWKLLLSFLLSDVSCMQFGCQILLLYSRDFMLFQFEYVEILLFHTRLFIERIMHGRSIKCLVDVCREMCYKGVLIQTVFS